MDLEPGEQITDTFENSTLLGSFIVGGLVAIATVATRKGAEKSWQSVFKRPPPHKRDPEDADVKEAMLWAVVIGATSGLVRLAVRRSVKPKARKLERD